MYNSDLPNRAELPSSKQLLGSTVIAAVVAIFLLVTVVLPAEYGIDPTGIGRVLSLTQMGEIKMNLAEEARLDREAGASQTGLSPEQAAPPNVSVAPAEAGDGRSDSMTVTLKPGQGVEIKLDMTKGAKVRYEWMTTGGGLNFDAHGDNSSKDFISYKKGTNADRDSGEIIADFDGSHGWFWRNRTGGDVTVTITTSGEYAEIKRVV